MSKTDLLLTKDKQSSSEILMSSREIAEICGKRHDHVMADIRNMLEELNFQSPDFLGDYIDSKGRKYPCFFLPKRETLILVSGYRIDLRAKIIDRLDELEKQQAVNLPQDLPAALRQLADKVEQNQVLLLENHQKTEHIHSLENYFQSGLTPPQFVKGLNGVNSQQINDFLRTKGWLYKDQSRCWRVFAHVRDKYLTEESKRIEVDPAKRIEMNTYKPVLLEKGAVKIFEFYMKGELPMRADWDGKLYHNKVAV